MRVVNEKTALAAVSELRTKMDDILKLLKEMPVTLQKHNKDVAVIEDPRRFAAMQAALEEATDILLAFEARKRELSGKGKRGRYLSLEEVEARFR